MKTNSFEGNTRQGHELVAGYQALISDRVRSGWNAWLLTFMFRPLPGSPDYVLESMRDELDRFYRTLATRVARRPSSASLPVLIAAPDLPVGKADKPLRDLAINDGLHFHSILACPPNSRLPMPVNEHLRTERALYDGPRLLRPDADRRFILLDGRAINVEAGHVRLDDGRAVYLPDGGLIDLENGGRLYRRADDIFFERQRRLDDIDVRPIDGGLDRAVAYVLKSIVRGRFGPDDVLVLPRSASELRG